MNTLALGLFVVWKSLRDDGDWRMLVCVMVEIAMVIILVAACKYACVRAGSMTSMRANLFARVCIHDPLSVRVRLGLSCQGTYTRVLWAFPYVCIYVYT